MRKLILSAIVALVALGAVASSASAFTATLTPGGEISSATLGMLELTGGLITIRCPVTLSGTLSEGPINVAAGERLGALNEVVINNERCSGGSVSGVLFTEAEEFEWPIVLSATPYGGTLPNAATEVNFDIVGAKFRLSVFGEAVNCLYGGTARNNRLAAVGTNPYTAGLITTAASGIPRVSGNFPCPASGGFNGTLTAPGAQSVEVI